MLAELIVLELTHLSHMHWLKGVPPIFCIPCFLVLQDWLQCTNYQNSILFHVCFLIDLIMFLKRISRPSGVWA